MTITFLPGEPNSLTTSLGSARWKDKQLLAYCSGNNLIILCYPLQLLQTIYLDADGVAVSVEEETSNIAVAVGRKVFIYTPVYEYSKSTQWVLSETLVLPSGSNKITDLSWGDEVELLISTDTQLQLWMVGTSLTPSRKLWSTPLANPPVIVDFTRDLSLAATVGKYDRLVKVWRRLSYDHDTVEFDYSFLPHPSSVTSIRWKLPFHKSESIENILYTTCTDGMLRVWRPVNLSDAANMQLWATIDLYEAVPRSLGGQYRSVCIVDNKDLSIAAESLLTRKNIWNHTKAKDPLIDIIQSKPELVLITDNLGHLAIFGIDYAGGAKQRLVRSFLIVPASLSPTIKLSKNCKRLSMFAYGVKTNNNTFDLSMVIHDYQEGSIKHYHSSLDVLLDPVVPPNPTRKFSLDSLLTGHNKSVQRLIRSSDGTAILSCSRFSENILWIPRALNSCSDDDNMTLAKYAYLKTSSPVRYATVSSYGHILTTLLEDNQIVVWDAKKENSLPKQLCSIKISPMNGGLLSYLLLPESESQDRLHILAIYQSRSGDAWEVRLAGDNGDVSTITKLDSFELPIVVEENETVENLYLVSAVDPVGWEATVGESLDLFQRDIITTVSATGVLRTWTARFNKLSQSIEWLESCKIQTEITHPSFVLGSSRKKVAISNKSGTQLSIYDTRQGILEFTTEFAVNQSITDLDWTCTPDNQNILAVGFMKDVVLYCQLRFDYTNKSSSWAPFRNASIGQYTTHNIGDSIWLSNGNLVIGTGNQFFIQDRKVDLNDRVTRKIMGSRITKINDIFSICSVLNGPLPFYHPQLLIQSVFAGKIDVAKRILVTLLKCLKFAVVLDSSVVDVTSYLDLPLDMFFNAENQETNRFKAGKFNQIMFEMAADDDLNQSFNTKVVEKLIDKLQSVTLPFLTRHQQITLVSTIEALGEVETNKASLDYNGIRFYLGYRLFKIHLTTQDGMSIRDFNWALHSKSQEVLLNLVEKSTTLVSGKIWQTYKDFGIPYWLNQTSLTEQVEKMARSQFLEDGKRDPTNCTLFYLLLRKKQTLLSLWRTASWHKEQQKMLKFLANDFTENRWRSAASKNAFALLGTHRFEYAAAFFLLAGSLKDCVNVIIRQMKDVPLAILVARVYEGDMGPVLKDLIERHIFPDAVQSGDRWLVSWGYWMLNRKSNAAKALIMAPSSIVANNEKQKNLSFLTEDPVQIFLYQQLRKHITSSTFSSGYTTPNIGDHSGCKFLIDLTLKSEFSFVSTVASLYYRMGCDVLALDVVKNWDFVSIRPSSTPNGTKTWSESFSTLNSRVNSQFDLARQNPSNIFGIDDVISGFSPISNRGMTGNIGQQTSSPAIASNPFGIEDNFTIPSHGRNPFGIVEDTTPRSRQPLGTEVAPATDENKANSKSEPVKKAEAKKMFVPPSQIAFLEPDMSAFNFGN
ncbi:hypothetical protein NADFUDRAFT_48835 [Nadsonia fulvescens var. elongata DSM 6958]|uniref:RAVE complex protein Rav1 C-terminal domain-containing protein n=1 Tax=Nadsonia fulvescens var. elongata DSM 6958 TaxID=857566 RepID=A0A1E3PRY7_9ASCO|nr:hypothetical protein NADFUDRAFT_48835 [Nadsonia fulvescens var. elongata DSM 6958]